MKLCVQVCFAFITRHAMEPYLADYHHQARQLLLQLIGSEYNQKNNKSFNQIRKNESSVQSVEPVLFLAGVHSSNDTVNSLQDGPH